MLPKCYTIDTIAVYVQCQGYLGSRGSLYVCLHNNPMGITTLSGRLSRHGRSRSRPTLISDFDTARGNCSSVALHNNRGSEWLAYTSAHYLSPLPAIGRGK